MAKGPYYRPGQYWGRITHQKLGQSKAKATPQLIVSFVVLGQIDPANPKGDLLQVMQQYERSLFMSVTDNTIEWVMRDLQRLGFVGDSFALFDEGTPNFCRLIDSDHAFYCQHEAGQDGQLREKWGLARENTGPTVTPLGNAEARKLDSLFGKQLKRLAAGPGPADASAPRKAPEPEPAPVSHPADDDIPFSWLVAVTTAVTAGSLFVA